MNRIKELRLAQGMKQPDLASLLNCTAMTVSRYERGEADPDVATILRLCDIFGCTADYLLGRSDLKTNKKQPAEDDELLEDIISRLQDLPDPALSRVSDFLDGLKAGQETAAAQAAAPDSSGEHAE